MLCWLCVCACVCVCVCVCACMGMCTHDVICIPVNEYICIPVISNVLCVFY